MKQIFSILPKWNLTPWIFNQFSTEIYNSTYHTINQMTADTVVMNFLRDWICLNFFGLSEVESQHCFISALTHEIHVSSPVSIRKRNSLMNFYMLAFGNLFADGILQLTRFVVTALVSIHVFAKTDNNELTAIWKLRSQQTVWSYCACAYQSIYHHFVVFL